MYFYDFLVFFLFAFVKLFFKIFTCVSNLFILFVLVTSSTLFEFLINVFSCLSYLFSSRSKVLIPSVLLIISVLIISFRLSFSSFISMSTLPGVISEISAGVQFPHAYFLFLLVKLYSWYDGRSEHLRWILPLHSLLQIIFILTHPLQMVLFQ